MKSISNVNCRIYFLIGSKFYQCNTGYINTLCMYKRMNWKIKVPDNKEDRCSYLMTHAFKFIKLWIFMQLRLIENLGV